MKKMILGILLAIAPTFCFAQGFTPDAAYWEWDYKPDTTTTQTGSVDNDDLFGNPASSFGFEEAYFEVFQIDFPDSCIDSVQFTIWGLRFDGKSDDSLASLPYTPDSSVADWPLHQALGASDSIWTYDKLYWRARWLNDGATVWSNRTLTEPTYRIRISAKKD